MTTEIPVNCGPRRFGRVLATLFVLSLASCQSEVASYLCYSIPGKDGDPINVAEYVPYDHSFTQYDVGNVHLDVYVEVHPDGVRDKSARVREICDQRMHLLSDHLSSPQVLKEAFRKAEDRRSRQLPVACNGFEGVDMFDAPSTADRKPTAYVERVVAGAWYVVTMSVSENTKNGREPKASVESMIAFLDALDLRERSVMEAEQ